MMERGGGGGRQDEVEQMKEKKNGKCQEINDGEIKKRRQIGRKEELDKRGIGGNENRMDIYL